MLGVRSAIGQTLASASPVTRWTDRTLGLIRKYRQNPLRAARALAAVHVAMNEAISQSGDDAQERTTALHAAAGIVLEFLYPQETAGRLGALAFAAAFPNGQSDEGRRKQVWNHGRGAWSEAALSGGCSPIVPTKCGT